MTKTISPDNAQAGDMIHILRLGLGAHRMFVENGGPSGGTLFDLPPVQSWWVKVYFDGANWVAHSAGQMP